LKKLAPKKPVRKMVKSKGVSVENVEKVIKQKDEGKKKSN
jgi:hypothetical protein